MQTVDSAALRLATVFLDRYRRTIEAEVDRRLGRGEPPPEVRLEVVRRFRSFCRLASFGVQAARPSLDGLGGNSAIGIERTVETAVEVALECGPPGPVAQALESLSSRFRTGVRRIVEPDAHPKQKRRRRRPNAGRRVRAAIDRISDAYLALCLDTGTIFDLNPTAEALLGRSPEELLGQPFSRFVAPSDRNEFVDLEARLDAGESSGPMGLGLIRPQGERIEVEITVSNHTIGGRRLGIFIARERGYSTRRTTSPESRVSSELRARLT
ncbi:MAG: PAS domain-containing protein [Myxococcota bacterium]